MTMMAEWTLGLGAGLLLVYGWLAWRHYGPFRWPAQPVEAPPAGLSPAAARFLWLGRTDLRGLLAVALEAAVAGAYRISWGSRSFRLSPLHPRLLTCLSPEARQVWLDHKRPHPGLILGAGISLQAERLALRLHESLSRRYRPQLFPRLPWIAGLTGLSLLPLAGMAMVETGRVQPSLLLYLLLLGIASVLPALRFNWGPLSTRRLYKQLFAGLLLGALVLLWLHDRQLETPLLGYFAPLVGIHAIAGIHLPRYTRAGHEQKLELAAFRQYLQARLQGPPLDPAEAYLLPYAVALEVPGAIKAYFDPLLRE
jgi:hypothetical protein